MPDYPVRISVQMDEKMARELEERAAKLDRPVAYLVRAAIREYLDRPAQ